jgi:hypothetical protein
MAVNKQHMQLVAIIGLQFFISYSFHFLYNRAVREHFQIRGTFLCATQSLNINASKWIIGSPPNFRCMYHGEFLVGGMNVSSAV